MAWLLPGARTVGGVTFDIHSLLYAAVAAVVGLQSLLFGVFTKIYGMREGMLQPDPKFFAMVQRLSLERGLVLGGILLVVGIGLAVRAVGAWDDAGFGSLRADQTMRLAIPSATALLVGFQLIYGCFFISVLEIRSTRSRSAFYAG